MSTNSVQFNSDLYTYDYFLQDDICRLCWGSDATHDITSKTSQKQDMCKNEIVDKIIVCLDLDFRNDTFTKKLCNSCFSKIEEFYQFKTFCREADRKMRQIVSKYHEKVIPYCDIKIEKNDSESSDLETKDASDDFLINSKETDNTSDRLQSDNEIKTEENLQPKKKKYRLKKTPTYCYLCRFDFKTKENFTSHNASCHGIEEDGLFKCFGCEKRFKSQKTRIGHEINFCKGLKDGYKCPKCDRYLPKRRTYEAHMRAHQKKPVVELPEDIFQCFKCSKLFKTKVSLKEHMVEHEGEKRHFICETCGRVFTRQDYLYKHKMTHTGMKQHVCPHCDFRTSQRSSLTMHIRRHTGERPYVCDVCSQRCVSSSNLRAHRKRHLGNKHYECKICNKKFGYKISLDEHVSSSHERSQQYPCGACAAVYTRARGLKRHLLSKHQKLDTDGDTTQEKMAADEYLKMADDGEKKDEEVVEEVMLEVKGDQFVILNEEGDIY